MSRRSFPQIDPSALRDHADEARVDRVWERVEHDLSSRFGAPEREARRARRSTFAYVAIAAAFGAFGAGLWVGKVTWDRKATVEAALPMPVIDKSRVEVFAAGSQLRQFSLEGGGRLTLSPGGTAEVERSGTEITVSILQGEASIDSTGRKQLAVVAGAARINTQGGSVLTVTRNAYDIDVKVDDGTVSISSPAGTQQLGKGERAAAVPIQAVTASTTPDAPARHHAAPPARRPTGPRAHAVKVANPEWLARYENDTDEEGALQLLRKQGVNQAIDTAKTANELGVIADIMARKGRDPAAEIRAWERLVQVFPSDQRAPLAADRLARIFEARGEAARAAEYRAKVRPLAESATMGRDSLICDAISRDPDKTRAALAAKEYLVKYPNGECRERFELLVQGSAAAPDPGPAAPDPAPVPAPPAP
ncbi:Hypothetical protein A7982_11067 [Minicystis rosea]|nr:Hypothetical protein A7982_11067 [Minicystis rosea]